MFLNTLPFAASPQSLHIPSWNRAPLGLGDQTHAILVRTDDPNLEHTDRHDFILTAFSDKTWGDLWTITLQLRDAPGQFSRLVDILDSFKITVLASESRQAYRERFFSISLVIDCSRYVSDIDGDSKTRVTTASTDLIGLQAAIFAEFVCEVRLVGLSHPRLQVQRNWNHYDLYRDFISDDSRLFSPSTDNPRVSRIIIDDGGWIRFPQHLSKLLSNSSRWRAYLSTNTRARLIHITLSSQNDFLTLNMVFYFDRYDEVLSSILLALRQRKYNILRHQLRPFLLAADKDLKDRLSSLREPYTLNVLLEASERGNLSYEQRCNEIRTKLFEICKHNRITVIPVPTRKPFTYGKHK